jgi:hypothetical protein
MRVLEERLLRYAAPVLYNKMVETFSSYHIHPYDVQATVCKNENGFDVSLKFSADLFQSVSHKFTIEQVAHPDEDVSRFFQESAEKCKSLLIADYYKMMKL